MDQEKKQVLIQLKTVIRDGHEEEVNNLRMRGIFFQKGKLDVLNFTEEMEENKVTTLVTIQDGKIAIKRSGAVSMHQQFRLGQTTENVYKHPHGNILMETYTERVHYRPLTSDVAALLSLDYTVKLNGQDARKHTLELLFSEEDAK